jgi:opacity protein-like surface antigen
MKKQSLAAIFSIFLVCNFEALAQEAKPFHKVDFNTLPSAQKIEKPFVAFEKPAAVEKPSVVEKPAILKTEKKELEVKKPIKETKKFATKKSETPIQNVKEEPKKTIQKKPEPVLLKPQIIQRKEQTTPPQEKSVKSNFTTKTEGSYLEADLVAFRTTFLVHDASLGTPYVHPPANQDMSYGVGLGYKYAVNFNNFFIAPGIFFEKNATGKAKGRIGVSLNNRSRYGLKSDFGYDFFNGRFSPYLTSGYAEIDYRTRSYGGVYVYVPADDDYVLKDLSAGRDGKDRSWFYGAGFKVGLTKSTSLNIEYNYQKYIAKGSPPEESAWYLSNIYHEAKLETLKLGLSYNF